MPCHRDPAHAGPLQNLTVQRCPLCNSIVSHLGQPLRAAVPFVVLCLSCGCHETQTTHKSDQARAFKILARRAGTTAETSKSTTVKPPGLTMEGVSEIRASLTEDGKVGIVICGCE